MTGAISTERVDPFNPRLGIRSCPFGSEGGKVGYRHVSPITPSPGEGLLTLPISSFEVSLNRVVREPYDFFEFPRFRRRASLRSMIRTGGPGSTRSRRRSPRSGGTRRPQSEQTSSGLLDRVFGED